MPSRTPRNQAVTVRQSSAAAGCCALALCLFRSNPYCSFKSDKLRLQALKSRDRRLAIIAIAAVVAHGLWPVLLKCFGLAA